VAVGAPSVLFSLLTFHSAFHSPGRIPLRVGRHVPSAAAVEIMKTDMTLIIDQVQKVQRTNHRKRTHRPTSIPGGLPLLVCLLVLHGLPLLAAASNLNFSVSSTMSNHGTVIPASLTSNDLDQSSGFSKITVPYQRHSPIKFASDTDGLTYWMAGSATVNNAGLSTSVGDANDANYPATRHGAVNWVGNDGHLYLYGEELSGAARGTYIESMCNSSHCSSRLFLRRWQPTHQQTQYRFLQHVVR
jgi:hypothetical protein